MTNASCSWREEEVIDLVLGKLSADKEARLMLHLPHCQKCSASHREWSALLGDGASLPMPSPSIRHRLKRRITWSSRLTTIRRRIFAKPAVRWAVPVLALCAASLLALPRGNPVPPELPTEVLTREMSLVMDPHTVLHVVPVDSGHLKGYIWINNASNELLILTDGLSPLVEKDYQVWFITENRRSHVGLLGWKDGIAHLYFRGGELRQAENIAITIEPKGGSFSPTGPDTIFLNLK
ncbi:MAG: anti-sigma factor [Brevibacillus sp.]|nr:anti-sigma factor [Brevibacillus sp.]